jgi:hypothetical protein
MDINNFSKPKLIRSKLPQVCSPSSQVPILELPIFPPEGRVALSNEGAEDAVYIIYTLIATE